MAETHRIAICSDALVLLGEEGIDSFSGSGAGKIVSRARFAPVANLLLSAHPWDFTKRVGLLNRLADPIPAAIEYTGAYRLPADLLRLVRPIVSTVAITDAWQVVGTTLYLDAEVNDTVSIEYHAAVDEALWPPSFREAMVYRLAAEFCLPIREDARSQQAWMQMADAHLRMAKHTHAVQAPRPPLVTGRLAARRLT